jgi:hypothetical protein
MNGWMIVWKAVFVIGLTLFAGLAVWVTVAGYADIKKLFSKLEKERK